MIRTEPAKDRFNGRSILASALFHSLLLGLAFLVPVPAQISAPQEESVDVEIVDLPPPTPEQTLQSLPQVPLSKTGKAVSADKPEPEIATPINPQQAEPSEKGASTRVKPTRMLSEGILADRHSREAKLALSQLAPAEQVEQLCNLEAMAQVGQWSKDFLPDRVVAYAMADTKLEGNFFFADGAAVHSKQDWYNIQFKCDLTPDHKKVEDFEFTVGDPIPKEDWSEHSLPDEDVSFD